MIGRLCLCLCYFRSENQLESKLDNTVIALLQSIVSTDVAGDLPEVWRIERNASANTAYTSRTRSGEIHMVRKVKGFGADLERLAFADGEGPRYRHIDLYGMRPFQAVVGQIAVCTRVRRSEGGCVDPLIRGLLSRVYIVWIDQIRRLVSNRRQRPVRARKNREQLGGRDGHDRGELPVACQKLECSIRKFRRCRNRAHAEELSPVDTEAIAAEFSAIPSDGHTPRSGIVRINIADAVRPGVICLPGKTAANSLLDRKVERFITSCGAVVDLPDAGIVFTPVRVDQIQEAPGLLISYRGALLASDRICSSWIRNRYSI